MVVFLLIVFWACGSFWNAGSAPLSKPLIADELPDIILRKCFPRRAAVNCHRRFRCLMFPDRLFGLLREGNIDFYNLLYVDVSERTALRVFHITGLDIFMSSPIYQNGSPTLYCSESCDPWFYIIIMKRGSSKGGRRFLNQKSCCVTFEDHEQAASTAQESESMPKCQRTHWPWFPRRIKRKRRLGRHACWISFMCWQHWLLWAALAVSLSATLSATSIRQLTDNERL